MRFEPNVFQLDKKLCTLLDGSNVSWFVQTLYRQESDRQTLPWVCPTLRDKILPSVIFFSGKLITCLTYYGVKLPGQIGERSDPMKSFAAKTDVSGCMCTNIFSNRTKLQFRVLPTELDVRWRLDSLKAPSTSRLFYIGGNEKGTVESTVMTLRKGVASCREEIVYLKVRDSQDRRV